MFTLLKRKPKVFCVGFNKTGTTSLTQTLKELGYHVGKQSTAEDLLYDWAKRDFKSIIAYCRTGNAFQDIPFSLPYTYQALDAAFPNSRFILTVRNSSDAWFNSLQQFHQKLFNEGNPLEEQHLANATYRHKGWMLDFMRFVFDYPNTPLYDKETYIKVYERHNAVIIDYFKNRPNDLLVLNLSEADAYNKFRVFLGLPPNNGSFPWLLKNQ